MTRPRVHVVCLRFIEDHLQYYVYKKKVLTKKTITFTQEIVYAASSFCMTRHCLDDRYLLTLFPFKICIWIVDKEVNIKKAPFKFSFKIDQRRCFDFSEGHYKVYSNCEKAGKINFECSSDALACLLAHTKYKRESSK